MTTTAPVKTVTVDVGDEQITFVRSFFQFAAVNIASTGMTFPPLKTDLKFIGGVTLVAPSETEMDVTVIMKMVFLNPGTITSIGFRLTRPGFPSDFFPIRISTEDTGAIETQSPNDEIHISGIQNAGETWTYDFFAAGKLSTSTANVNSVILIAQLR